MRKNSVEIITVKPNTKNKEKIVIGGKKTKEKSLTENRLTNSNVRRQLNTIFNC